MEEPAQWAPHSLGGLPGVVIFIGQVFLGLLSYPTPPGGKHPSHDMRPCFVEEEMRPALNQPAKRCP